MCGEFNSNGGIISVTLQDLQKLEEEVRGQRLPRQHLPALEVTSRPSLSS